MPLAHCTLVDVPRATSNSNPRNEAAGLSGSVPELSSRPPEPRLFKRATFNLKKIHRRSFLKRHRLSSNHFELCTNEVVNSIVQGRDRGEYWKETVHR